MIKELVKKLLKIEERKQVSEKELEAEKRQKQIKQFKDKYYQERAKRLSSIVEHLQLSKEELSERLDMSEESINSLVTDPRLFLNKRNFYEPLYQLAMRLNVNPDYLVAGVGDMFLNEEEARAIRSLKFAAAPEEMFTMMIYMKYSRLLCLNIANYFETFLFSQNYIILEEIEDNKIKLEKK